MLASNMFIFFNIIKEAHVNSNCSDDCDVFAFARELFLHLRYKRHYYRKRSTHLLKKLLLCLCEKNPWAFSNNYFIFKNKVLEEEEEDKKNE